MPPLRAAIVLLSVAPFVGSPIGRAAAPKATVTTETRMIATYPFSEPNPVPILTRDRRLYPYHSFEGYAHSPEPRPWKVVRLQNPWIEVLVLPEVGGKVWGAIVRKTGHAFVYWNEVLKFRNIALRGPWTSGGIEFNFGVIGHAPSTATPVDYLTRENADGSVSCIVGTMDLPSRTHWRVEIRLPADRANFETRALWYNPTPLEQPYYNWMTAAAVARPDLELAFPGNAYLQHSGRVLPWPMDDEGRRLSLYRENAFGGSKSYHVVGELHDFFGGYYHDAGWGFGHWARYEDMPGQKAWLWALSREGGIWENLLTDTNGQYIEFQAGRLFVQYSPGGVDTPITQAGFDPLSADTWRETWFPLEGLGGLSAASPAGAVGVQAANGRVAVRVNAFSDTTATIEAWTDGRKTATRPVKLAALAPFEATFDLPAQKPFRIRIPELAIDYRSDRSNRQLSRPFATDPAARPSLPEAETAVLSGRELLKARRYPEARVQFERALELQPWNREALLGQAELSYRRARFAAGLEFINLARQLDAYDAKANFLAGILYRALGQTANARDAFGWAARSMAYRSAANVELAELMLADDLPEAERYARLALDYDRRSIPAWEVLAIIGRLRDAAGSALASEAAERLLEIDPLHHFVRAERYLADRAPGSAQALQRELRGELPGQILLELAIAYASRGQRDDARAILRLDRDASPEVRAWEAWLVDDPKRLQEPGPLAFAFPYRTESIAPLAWAVERSRDWRWRYLLALNLAAIDRDEDAREQLRSLGDEPDFAPLYVVRASLAKAAGSDLATADLRRAVALDPSTRILRVELIRHLQDTERWADALAASSAARTRFVGDFALDLLHGRSLLHLDRAAEAAAILDRVQVLPSENARGSHQLYVQAHTLTALDALEAGRFTEAAQHLRAAFEWPESLGQGRPYEPEERLFRFLLGRVAEREGRSDEARAAFAAVIGATPKPGASGNRLDLLALPALAALGRTDELRAIASGSRDGRNGAAVAMARALVDGNRLTREILEPMLAGRSRSRDALETRILVRALTLPARNTGR